MRRALLAASGVLLFACLLFVPLAETFTFTETRADEPALHYIRVDGNRNFVIRYTHSIHLSDVVETYAVTDDGKIRLARMEYEDLAIGLPGHAEEGETFSEKDGRYVLEYDDKVLDSFVLLIADIDADLEFRHGGRNYDLKEKLQRGKAYDFRIRKLSLFELMKGMNMNGG